MAASTQRSQPGLGLIKKEFWYAGSISERKTEQVLTKLEKGAFLVRESLLPDADYVLSVNGGEEISHYNIKVWPTDECVFNNYTFTNLPDAITFYTENRLGSVFLLEPTKPVVSEQVLSKVISPQIKAAPSPIQQPRPTPLESPLSPDHIDSKTATDVCDEQKEVWQSSSKHVQEPTTPLSPQHGWQSSSPAQPKVENHHSQSPQIFTFNRTEHENERTRSSEMSGEVKQSFIQPTKEIESVYIGTPDLNDGHHLGGSDAPKSFHRSTEPKSDVNTKLMNVEKQETSLTSTSSQSVSHSGDSDANTTPNLPLKTPQGEQLEEFSRLSSIKQKKQALEQRLRGEEISKPKAKEKKLPPPVPKRTVFRNNSEIESKHPKENTDDPQIETADMKPTNKAMELISETVKSSVKNTPPPIPKRLSIPNSFQHLPGDDEDTQKIPPPVIPKRVTIPESLQVRPPPPPMSTHPGLTKKEEERYLLQQEQEKEKEKEKEKVSANKPKKRLSFFKKKGKDKDKRKSSTRDEPVLQEDSDRLRKESLDSATGQVSEGPHPRRLSGVPTPGMMPNFLNASGGEVELLSMFKVITKQEKQLDNESEDNKAITDSTFGKTTPKMSPSSPETITNSGEKSEIKKPKKEVTRSNSIEVSTFKPVGDTTASPSIHESNGVPPTSPVSPADNGVPPTSPVSPAENGVPPTSPVSPANNGVPPTSPVSPADNGVPPTSPVSPADNGVPPTSPVSPADNGVPPTSPVSPANNGIPPTSPVSPANNGVPPTSPVSPADNGVPPTSPVSPANNGIPPTSSVSPADNGLPPTSPVSTANNGDSPTSPMSAESNGDSPTFPVSAETLPFSPTHIQNNPVVSPSDSRVLVSNRTSSNTDINSTIQSTSITSTPATTNTSPNNTTAVASPSPRDSPLPVCVTTKKSDTKLRNTSSVPGAAVKAESGKTASRPLGPRTQSLIDVVPGLSRTLPRNLSTTIEDPALILQRREEINFSQISPGIRIPVAPTGQDRRNTTGSTKPKPDPQVDPSIGPMNTRRDKSSRRRSGIFSKNK